MKPIKNQILFKPINDNKVTQGGLFLPESYLKDSDKGLIVEVGPGTKERPMRLQKGMTVFRVHEWGTLVEKDGESFYLMDDSAILATL